MVRKNKVRMDQLKAQVKELTFTNFITHCHQKMFSKADQVYGNQVPTPLSLHGEEKKPKLEKKRVFKGLVNDRSHRSIFCGKAGSGKTTLLLKLLLSPGGWYKCYSKIIIISSTYEVQYEKTWS